MSTHSDTLKALVWAPAQEAPRRLWVDRIAAALGALVDDADVSLILRYDEARHPHPVAPDDVDALEAIVAATVNTEGGSVFHRLGSDLGLIAVGPTGDPDDGFTRVGFSVGVSAEGMMNVAEADVPTGAAPVVLRRWIGAWSPMFACVISSSNLDARREEIEPGVAGEIPRLDLDQMLHWVSWYGPDRAASLPLDRLAGRADVSLQEVHGGTEIRLGEQWPGETVLRERQRQLEPLLFSRDSVERGLWRRLRGR